MARNFLEEIVEHKREMVARKASFYTTLRDKFQETDTRYGLFKKCIARRGDQLNLIAEIKKASPSRGILRTEFDLLGIAEIYAKQGAAAVSVLTEDKYFLGRPEYVRKVADAIRLPVLTKDFIINDGQIYEARFNGAAAVLLIVAILTDADLKALMKTASRLDVDCLVEVHDRDELHRALAAGAQIIGINNRNLKTFEVDLSTSLQLLPLIPEEIVRVVESGIKEHREITMLKDAGAHAVLIGETFMRSADIAAKIRELVYNER